MEKSKLEKLIKKLGTLDIREWNYDNNDGNLTTEVCGVKLQIHIWGRTYLMIKNTGDNIGFEDKEYFNSKETKALKKVIENFYKKTYESLLEYENKQLAEKLDTFLSD